MTTRLHFDQFYYQKDCEQHKNIKHIGLEELGNSKLCEILLRRKLSFSLESDKSGDDYEPNSDSETDNESQKKTPSSRSGS